MGSVIRTNVGGCAGLGYPVLLLITGLVLSRLVALAAETIQDPSFLIKEFVVEGDNPLSDYDIDNTMYPFVNEPADLDRLNSASAALQRLLHKRGYTSHRVIIPEQTLQDGIVRLRVIAFKVGNVEIEGNQHFSSTNILGNLSALKPESSPKSKKLSRQLLLANEHPAKTLSLTFREGAQPRTIDALVVVQDHRPYNVFATVNNRSSRSTPDTRLTLGLQHSNLFNRDHTLTGTYTTSPENLSRVEQYGLNYQVPVYALGGAFRLYYIKSDVDTGRVAGNFDVSGEGEFVGGSYKHHLLRLGKYSHSISLDIADNLFKNDVSFSGMPIGTDVRSRPLSLRYDGGYRLKQGTTDFHITFRQNLPGGSKNSNSSYARTTQGADQDWQSWRFGFSHTHALGGGWRVNGRFESQYSDERLIPGEQFGVGGANSVRGYDDRIVAGDSGLAASLEVWSPPIKYNVQAIGFIDAGYEDIHHPLPGETENDDLYGVGLGLRGFWNRNASLAVDIAWALSDAGSIDAGHTRVHFNLVLNY